jgi:hypothetical protein
MSDKSNVKIGDFEYYHPFNVGIFSNADSMLITSHFKIFTVSDVAKTEIKAWRTNKVFILYFEVARRICNITSHEACQPQSVLTKHVADGGTICLAADAWTDKEAQKIYSNGCLVYCQMATHARCDFMQSSSDGSICYSSENCCQFR